MSTQIQQNLDFVITALEDIKAQDITTLNVDHLTDMMSYMLVTTGTSKQHCNAIAKNLIEKAKKGKIEIIGVEGRDQKEWVLVDFGDIVVHIMIQSMRDFYELEKLWDIPVEQKN